ncbi:putative glycosyl transferase [Alloactinosynnema sp. L-07]|uniref:nucleotide disphospho-sugar-binding domain-containing protein n=1 Tax=Alloactinosynnema sp. L-07 TaxID=1653480 RepID=UPI00065EF968|nr:nucleotide disphospho-sugar-binding domain-containing protein [Alloactinosynnema sp. L-07]CRK61865.1 putative glycosyl transferase [Alloactinosynnema sp. L-07]
MAVFPIDAVGHVNPMLAVLGELTSTARVRTFGSPDLASVFHAAGAEHVGIDSADGTPDIDLTPDPPPDLSVKTLIRPLATMPELVARAAEFQPDVVLYDVFGVAGAVVANHLGLPSASLVALPGYGALTDDFVDRYRAPHPALAAAGERYRERFGWNPLGSGLPVLFPSPDLSLITAVEAMSRPVDPDTMPRLHALLGDTTPTAHHVGPCFGGLSYTPDTATSAESAAAHDRGAGFPFAVLDRAKAAGDRVILFSLGTVLADFRYLTPVGGAETGRDYLLRLLDQLIAAFGDRDGYTVVAGVGARLPSADEPRWPANFVVRDYLPQVRLLDDYADVFITHHGMNSTVESILAGVPMVSVPGAGDQLTNAALAVAHGAAVARWHLHNPYGTCTAATLDDAVHAALEDPQARTACHRLRAAMTAAGGAAEAADLVRGLVR